MDGPLAILYPLAKLLVAHDFDGRRVLASDRLADDTFAGLVRGLRFSSAFYDCITSTSCLAFSPRLSPRPRTPGVHMPPKNEDSGAKSLVGVLEHDRERDEDDLAVQREEDGDEEEERDERGVEVLHGEGAPGVGEEEAEDREQAD